MRTEQEDETNEFRNLVGIIKDSKPEFKLPLDSECIRENKKCPVLIRIDQKEEDTTRLKRELDVVTRHSANLSKTIDFTDLYYQGRGIHD